MANTIIPESQQPVEKTIITPQPKRQGRPVKSLSQRTIKRTTPYKTTKPKHSKKKKIEVLVWLSNYRVPLTPTHSTQLYNQPTKTTSSTDLIPIKKGYKRPTYSEAAAYFKIPSTTIAV
ncbi:hypothetical protein F5B20DRAFT_564785 [Whalleya microplaca]|nr:hypothetical protein F5B20DRAFT_564785 [Whalleya microplaca]